MKYLLKTSLFLAFILCVAGCSSLLRPEAQGKAFYVIVEDSKPAEVSGAKLPLRLLVSETRAPSIISGRRMVFSSAPSQRGYYQFSSWAEPPPKRFTSLLIEKLEHTAMFKSIAREESLVLGDILLRTEMLDFYHDVHESPSRVYVKIVGELIDMSTRQIVSRREFLKAKKAESADAEGAVAAFTKAVHEISREVVSWIKEETSKAVESAGPRQSD